MPHLPAFAFFVCPLLVCASAASATEAAFPVQIEEGLMVVHGLAPGDSLNVRAAASPLGKTLGRLPSGALVKRRECEVVERYEWCRVDAVDVEELSGWTPARYLHPLSAEGGDTAEGAEAPEEADETKTARLHQADKAADQPASAPETLLPEGLEARFADAPSPEPQAFAPRQEQASVAPPRAGEIAPAGTGRPSVPVPTPRPVGEDVAAVADAVPPGAGAEIPCARHVGQPMTRCAAHAARNGHDATVTVVWPDGGSRVIEFRGGVPAGSDSSGELRFTREGTLNMIRIGVSERFEIVDALPFGG